MGSLMWSLNICSTCAEDVHVEKQSILTFFSLFIYYFQAPLTVCVYVFVLFKVEAE